MATPQSRRPLAPNSTQSFSRFETTPTSPISRSRASTQNGTRPLNLTTRMTESPLEATGRSQQDDIFEKSSLISGEEGSVKDVEEVDSPNDIPDGFDDLPIELISLIDRFIDSLGAKVYNTPPSIRKLSSMFQDFYTKAESHIATHISALSTRQSRGASPSASISSKSSQARQPLRSASKDTLNSLVGLPEQQMLTPREVSDRRRARRLLSRKGVALEEAVERRVCERVYSRIWRHRSTLDDVRDEKLRSRTAALALVGIGLKDLGIDMKDSQLSNEFEVEDWISKARDGLLRMNDAKYPLGKLQQLAAAHKSIVDLLTELHHSSSSADEILPTLIYTLITTPPEGINVISNLQFIQRFRASGKVDGEAAYCLTNLEAAVTFLETVDLASLRSDESLQGPSPSRSACSRPATPHSSVSTSSLKAPSSVAATTVSPEPVTEANEHGETIDHPLKAGETGRSPSHRRRVSDLFQPPATALGAAGDAVLNTADQGLKSIGSALDNSFKLLFGRLGEQQATSPRPDAANPIVVPKTLEDARKLIEPKPAEDDSTLSDAGSLAERLNEESPNPLSIKPQEPILSALAGRKQVPRERSVDSHQSTRPPLQEIPSAGNAAVESMRSIGNAFNPLKLGGSVMRGFTRTSSSGTPAASVPADHSIAETQPASNGERPSPPAIKTLPPVQRFLDAPDPQNLKIGDVYDLLQDYKRLAEALRTMGAF